MLRLKTRSQFQAVLACSKLATSTHFAVHHLASDSPAYQASFMAFRGSGADAPDVSAQPWLGAMVPKRWARRAVTRNAIRRQIHEVARAMETGLESGAWVVRLRAGFDRTQFPSASSSALKTAVGTELREVMSRAVLVRRSKSLQGLAK
ncbi:MAG: ribonuclease P protein component [Rhodoferax sp.]|nr:ribonuclease P protein component [Rhodoferax sp.]